MTDSKRLNVATIIPGQPNEGSSVHMANGTRVMLSDGSELSGVVSVTLRAEAGGVWMASIEVRPAVVPSINVQAETHVVDGSLAGLATDGCTHVPTDGTWILEKGEKVVRRGM